MASRVTVYVKPECGLCGPVWKTVQKVREDVDFVAEKIDIAKDAELLKKYGLEVPVVMINGRKAFKGAMTEQAFKKKLHRLSAHASEGAGDDDEGLVLEPPPFIPSPTIIILFLALALAGAGWFVVQGMNDAQLGRGRLASTLFRVDRAQRDRAVDFDLQTLDGRKVALSDFRGKVLFINFWATWCPPCIEELPSMKRFYEKMKGDPRFAFVAISADDGWDPVRRFFEKEAPPFTVLLDESGKIAREYGTEKFPETYVVIDGRIVGYIIGPRDWDTWYAEAYARAVLDHGAELRQDQIALR